MEAGVAAGVVATAAAGTEAAVVADTAEEAEEGVAATSALGIGEPAGRGWDGCATHAHTAVIPQDCGMPLGEGFMVNAWVLLDGNGFWCANRAQLLDFFFFLPSSCSLFGGWTPSLLSSSRHFFFLPRHRLVF